MKVREWMTAEPMTVTAATTVGRARDLLETRGVRHLPVVDAHGHVVGIVSNRDVAITDALLRAAVRQHDVAALLDDDRHLIGILTTTDCLLAVLHDADRPSQEPR